MFAFSLSGVIMTYKLEEWYPAPKHHQKENEDQHP
jgi:hypothetical protein